MFGKKDWELKSYGVALFKKMLEEQPDKGKFLKEWKKQTEEEIHQALTNWIESKALKRTKIKLGVEHKKRVEKEIIDSTLNQYYEALGKFVAKSVNLKTVKTQAKKETRKYVKKSEKSSGA